MDSTLIEVHPGGGHEAPFSVLDWRRVTAGGHDESPTRRGSAIGPDRAPLSCSLTSWLFQPLIPWE